MSWLKFGYLISVRDLFLVIKTTERETENREIQSKLKVLKKFGKFVADVSACLQLMMFERSALSA